MNKLIYELTINDWFLTRVDENYDDDCNCYNFHHQKLKGFDLDIFVSKDENKPMEWELWVSRFNFVGIYNRLDEIYTYADYMRLQSQLLTLINTFEEIQDKVKEILEPFEIPMKKSGLTYENAGLDLRDIYEYNK